MNDAALDHDILEDGFGALFQAGYAVHADKKDILYTTALDLVKYLHPVVFSLRIPDPDTQHVLDSIYIIAQDKELARVDQKAIAALGEKDILFMFPRMIKGKSTTRLVLKKPKTETSIRKIWLPKTLAYILRDWKERQEKLKEFMGDEYVDYNLVLALETGRPCEDRVIENQFERLKKSASLPNVVFHSLRHPNVKLKTKSFSVFAKFFEASVECVGRKIRYGQHLPERGASPS